VLEIAQAIDYSDRLAGLLLLKGLLFADEATKCAYQGTLVALKVEFILLPEPQLQQVVVKRFARHLSSASSLIQRIPLNLAVLLHSAP